MSIARWNVSSLLWLALVLALVFVSPAWADAESQWDLWQQSEDSRGVTGDEDEDEDEDEDGEGPDVPVDVLTIEGLSDPAEIVYDQYDVASVYATTELDAIFLEGYLHAKDRFFQMDSQRRQFSGTLGELLGPAALPSDVQFRTLGLRRAAEASWPVQTADIQAWLSSYAAGVNAYLNDPGNPLPPEYFALETTKAGVAPWTVIDSLVMVKGLAAGLSFNTSDIDRTIALLTFRAVLGDTSGFILHATDLYRVAPFDPTISIQGGGPLGSPGDAPIEAEGTSGAGAQQVTQRAPSRERAIGGKSVLPGQRGARQVAGRDGRATTASTDEEGEVEDLPEYLNDSTLRMLLSYREKVADIPFLDQAIEGKIGDQGSNWWVVGGGLTESGFPMIANDPHLSLGNPATFYELHLNAQSPPLNVNGVSFPGAPGIVIGCNSDACWSATVNAMDVTDIYQEVLVANSVPGLPPGTPTHSIYQGVQEPLLILPQQYNINILNGVPDIVVDAGVPADQGGVVFVVPRRNNGPIVDVDFSNFPVITAISVQYTGWGPTQELEAFRQFARASSPQEFKDGLQFFDVGSQNWGYADVSGNIAYFTSGEMPLRTDLTLGGGPAGLIWPGIIRDGTGTAPHEWLPPIGPPQPNQILPYEILPFDEMPQVINPPSGYILNANNDPIGTTLDNVAWNQLRTGGPGLLYLSSGYATGYRQGQLQKQFDAALSDDGKLSLEESKAIQGNNQLLDAEVLAPHLFAAFDAATTPGADPQLAALGADPGIVEAIGRLQAWNFSTPTGLTQGYDPGDNAELLAPPTPPEVNASIAATIYSVWRGQLVRRVIDQSLSVFPTGATTTLADNAPGSAQAMSAVRRLLDNFQNAQGLGGVGAVNFFSVPGAPNQVVARDIVLLETVRAALDRLASDEFAPAFFNAVDQDEYRWGGLHRITFNHLLGGPFNIPPAGGLTDLTVDLPGLARAGGMGALDASSHSARAQNLNDFTFGSGPSRRSQAILAPNGPQIEHVIPGGQSGVLGSSHQADQLRLWLVNAYKPFPVDLAGVEAIQVRRELIMPAPDTGSPLPETDAPSEAIPEAQPGDAAQDVFRR